MFNKSVFYFVILVDISRSGIYSLIASHFGNLSTLLITKWEVWKTEIRPEYFRQDRMPGAHEESGTSTGIR